MGPSRPVDNLFAAVVFDALGQRTAYVANYDAVPWNALIDTSTMRVVRSIQGRPNDYEAFVQDGFDALPA